MIGLGAYAQCSEDTVDRFRPMLALAHLNSKAALRVRSISPDCYVILRPDDGNDDQQCNWSGDPLAEADFHMAYGLYDQAADLVKLAIAREPARRDLKLKLLEVYFVWGNKDSFLEAAQDLREEDPGGRHGWAAPSVANARS